jgi:mono/diheme cytochrome c family protein
VCAVFLTGTACNSLDKPIEETDGSRLVIPTDTRRPVRATTKPPPVTGGTLAVTRSGLAVASDPERDVIVIADLASAQILKTIALERGDEPGRLVEDAAGRVHVALRRGGAVVTIDPSAGTVLERRSVCGAPRGLAVSSAETLEVACADGKLVTLPTGSGAVIRSVALEPDLRDVVVQNGQVSVSRLKSAEVLRLDAAGAVTRRERPTMVNGTRLVRPEGARDDELGDFREPIVQPFRPLVAWRTLAGPSGSTVIVHQRSVDAPIAMEPPTVNGSSYGGGGPGGPGCTGIAQNAVTVIGPNGATADMTFAAAPLPVDATLLPDGKTLIIVHAGPADPEAPRPFVIFDGDQSDFGESDFGHPGGGGFSVNTVSVFSLPTVPTGTASPEGTIAPEPQCTFASPLPVTDPAVAVAYNPTSSQQIVVQTRQPSTLVIIDNLFQFNTRVIPFDDGSTRDTGFEIFHRDSDGGLACATCHAEGAEDGNVWRFEGLGDRRTQALNIGLAGTAPFHWDGALQDLGALMSEVFVGRMGGVHESEARLDALRDWIFAMQPPASLRPADDAAAVRGKAVFEDPSTRCASCHSGPQFTNDASRDVGTNPEHDLQVPSLVSIGYRAPFMHNGCAATLAARFDPACGGGERHGHTSDLTPEQISDLVAYLESL